MTHNFTPNDLVRFIYRETTAVEDAAIREWLTDDSAAFSLFHEMSDTVRSLDMKEKEPSETSINILLEFSKLSTHEESHA